MIQRSRYCSKHRKRHQQRRGSSIDGENRLHVRETYHCLSRRQSHLQLQCRTRFPMVSKKSVAGIRPNTAESGSENTGSRVNAPTVFTSPIRVKDLREPGGWRQEVREHLVPNHRGSPRCDRQLQMQLRHTSAITVVAIIPMSRPPFGILSTTNTLMSKRPITKINAGTSRRGSHPQSKSMQVGCSGRVIPASTNPISSYEQANANTDLQTSRVPGIASRDFLRPVPQVREQESVSLPEQSNPWWHRPRSHAGRQGCATTGSKPRPRSDRQWNSTDCTHERWHDTCGDELP